MNDRRQQARIIRRTAAELAYARPHPLHLSNGEEFRYRTPKNGPSLIANFTKGLPHNPDDGLLQDAAAYQQFVTGIQSGDPQDFVRTPLGPPNFDPTDRAGSWQSRVAKEAVGRDGQPGAELRAWESAGAGLTFDLQGPDAQALTMPPVPRLDSDELVGELAELYLMALLRDVPFRYLRGGAPSHPDVDAALGTLNALAWFNESVTELGEPERSRHRNTFTRRTLFRGVAPGDAEGPYLSQFLLLGSRGVNAKDAAYEPTDGHLAYGALRVDQRVRIATPRKDYLTTFEGWVDVQNGADLRGLETYQGVGDAGYRFMTTPRDLTTYVHYDALYEAYLNACLQLLSLGAPFDPGIPFQAADKTDKQQGFAQFGGPHILSLVTEVATRALKVVRYQKFDVHRRARPEALAGLIQLRKTRPHDPRLDAADHLVTELENAIFGTRPLLDAVTEHNRAQNERPEYHSDPSATEDSYLLALAFPEGSPMHPAYGAGHATVAGACVTILKAFFDHGFDLSAALGGVWEPAEDGSGLERLEPTPRLTLEGELNKLAANIAIGRNWAGVHYFTDYAESLRLGEQLALGILEEQKLTYGENFTMTVPLFAGGTVRI